MRHVILAVTLLTVPALAHADPATSAGPGKLVCKTAAKCELGIGDPVQMRYQIDPSALPDADKTRIGDQCKPKATKPCIVTIQGTENGDALKVKAASIKWYN